VGEFFVLTETTNHMKIKLLIGFACLCLFSTVPGSFGQGSLTPPGAPAPTMKSLTQVEPRTDVLTLSGNGNNQYIINQSGAYYLTTNITGVASKNAISILADNVVLDLNGFTLFGGTNNSQQAILVNGAHSGVIIRNGAITGWPGNGISAGSMSGGELERLRITTNGGIGLKLGGGNSVANCFVVGNSGDGIDSTSNCAIESCSVIGNTNGISTGNACTLRNCRVDNNVNSGITTGSNCSLTDCNVSGNSNTVYSANGISSGNGCTLKNCNESGSSHFGVIVGQNCNVLGCTVNDNDSYGLIANNGSTIVGCTANANADTGIYTYSGCTIKDCTCCTNEVGFETGDGCTIKDCTACLDYGAGFETGSDCTVMDCTASFDGDGIDAQSECTIVNCTACANDITGIDVKYSCLVKDNTTASNSRYSGIGYGGSGIEVDDSGNRIEGNNSNSDGFGIDVNGNENVVIRNTVRDAYMYNYDIASGNMVGTIVYAISSGAIQGNSGGSGMGSTDPWANFSF
jgi:hypothetical protein